jgi:hypothetical protein
MHNQGKRGGRYSQSLLIVIVLIVMTIALRGAVVARGDIAQQSKEDKKSDRAESDEKKETALSLLEGVLAVSGELKPVEYSILTQVEGGVLLWSSDQARATTIFRNAFKTLVQWRQAAAEKTAQKEAERVKVSKEKQTRVWFFVIRKIASVSPKLVEELLRENPLEKKTEAEATEWADEARAIMSLALEQIEKDPALAARLAESSLEHGIGLDWTFFLSRLKQRDSREAERLARVHIDWLQNVSFAPIRLMNLQRFLFAQDIPASLKEYYIQTLVARLRKDMRPDTPIRELEDDLNVARRMQPVAASISPRWQEEFQELTTAFEALFRARSMEPPGPPRVIMIDSSAIRQAEPASTHEITNALPNVEKIQDVRARDKDYQTLAVKAALSDNITLAEQIMAKISDDEFRRETTIRVYSPVIRKALGEKAFASAQVYAMKILDPLGRTLVLNRIGRTMLEEKEEKLAVMQVYTAALAKLDGEVSENGARAYLILAGSLLSVDHERALAAANSAVGVLNQLTKKGVAFAETKTSGLYSAWSFTSGMPGRPDDALDLAEMVTVFADIAKQEPTGAQSAVSGLTHAGLRALAQLAVCKAMLDQASVKTKPQS